MKGYLELSAVRPWWIRVLLLILVAVPLFSGGQLHTRLHADHPWTDVAGWLGYALFLWGFTLLFVGLDKLLQWLAIAFVFGLTLVLGGAAIAKLGVWEYLHRVFAVSIPPSAGDSVQGDLDLVFRLLMVTASLPYFLLVIHSFPATDVFAAAVRQGTRGRRKALVSLAVFLRLFQHVFEIFTSLLVAWREENPDMIVPRHRDRFGEGLIGGYRVGGWIKDSVMAWSLALLAHSFLFVPVVVDDWQSFFEA